ncbi:unnamed protein product [Periconia digitata]|uniref:Uncharacterized protein n=1 Tax=Periconia digitata TaxID=1303443 RepID=A0A9W4XH43_9PLEO|nr:unnamed protein product [Periconia digitata]
MWRFAGRQGDNMATLRYVLETSLHTQGVARNRCLVDTKTCLQSDICSSHWYGIINCYQSNNSHARHHMHTHVLIVLSAMLPSIKVHVLQDDSFAVNTPFPDP